jgi:hypothetical protein
LQPRANSGGILDGASVACTINIVFIVNYAARGIIYYSSAIPILLNFALPLVINIVNGNHKGTMKIAASVTRLGEFLTFGLLWSSLGYFGLLWATLGYFGLLWATLGYFGLLWATLG